MQYTSAEANKLLKKLMEEREQLCIEESQSSVFIAATVEDPKDAKPSYNFLEMQDAIGAVEEKIRKVKHAINVFNTTHVIEGFGTIDEVLVTIPQLNARKRVLSQMAHRLPKVRKQARYGEKSNFIEYEYANYNISQAAEMFKMISDTLAKAQLALDKANNSETMEIDI